MLAVGESLDTCEPYFDELIALTSEYIHFSLELAGIFFQVISGVLNRTSFVSDNMDVIYIFQLTTGMFYR